MEGSEIDISSNFQSESSITASSIGRPKTSDIHNHTRTARKGEPARTEKNQLIYYCKYCDHSALSTSGLRSHLKAKHQIQNEPRRTKQQIAEQSVTELYDILLAANRAKDLDQEVLTRTIDQQLVSQTLLDLIILHRLPFRIVQWPEFHNFCYALNPQSSTFIRTSHTSIKEQIKQHFLEKKDVVRKALQSARTKIHLSVDIWTSPNNHLLLAICASFVDHENRFWNLLIGLRPIYGHSGSVQWETILPLLEDYSIVQNIGTVIGDNSGTNDTLCRTMQDYFTSQFKIPWLASHQRIRCQGHILNLVVQAFLFKNNKEEQLLESYDRDDEEITDLDEKDEKIQTEEKKTRGDTIRKTMGCLGKLHNIVIHIRASAPRTAQFLKMAGRRIPLDNRTRWNSWSHMIDVAIQSQIQHAITSYCEHWIQDEKNPMDKRDIIQTEEWAQIRTIQKFLAPFKGATDYMQGNQATIERVLDSLDILDIHFQTSLVYRTIYYFHLTNNI
jgi:hypothetical protein